MTNLGELEGIFYNESERENLAARLDYLEVAHQIAGETQCTGVDLNGRLTSPAIDKYNTFQTNNLTTTEAASLAWLEVRANLPAGAHAYNKILEQQLSKVDTELLNYLQTTTFAQQLESVEYAQAPTSVNATKHRVATLATIVLDWLNTESTDDTNNSLNPVYSNVLDQHGKQIEIQEELAWLLNQVAEGNVNYLEQPLTALANADHVPVYLLPTAIFANPQKDDYSDTGDCNHLNNTWLLQDMPYAITATYTNPISDIEYYFLESTYQHGWVPRVYIETIEEESLPQQYATTPEEYIAGIVYEQLPWVMGAADCSLELAQLTGGARYSGDQFNVLETLRITTKATTSTELDIATTEPGLYAIEMQEGDNSLHVYYLVNNGTKHQVISRGFRLRNDAGEIEEPVGLHTCTKKALSWYLQNTNRTFRIAKLTV
ncbi:MAG: hypothetical protein R3B92_00685 [Patescibacteria group bacterium]